VESDTLLEEPAGIYLHNTKEKLTVTWNRLPEHHNPKGVHTFQLTLFPDGVFEMTFDDLPTALNYDIYSRWNTAWMIGALPGTGQKGLGLNSQAQKPQHVHFNAGLPLSGGPSGIVEDYHLAFRRALHRWLAPLGGLVLLSSAVVVLGLPSVFHRNLVKPLSRLLAGVRQIDAGNLDVHIPVQYGDEIGSLTHSFNTMAAELNGLVNDLEGRVAARTRELDASRKEAEAANALLETVLNNLDTLIYVSDIDTYEILFANQQIQEVFGPIDGRICWQVLQEGRTGPCGFCAIPPLLPPHNTANPIHHRELQNTRNGRWYTTADSVVEWIDGRRVHLSMLVDITDIKQTEAQLLAEQITVTLLQERQRLARDLHDSVTQSIHSLALFSETLGAALDRNRTEKARQLSERLQESAHQALKEMRLMLYELQPISLREHGDLAQALEARLQAVERRAGVDARLVLEGDPAWPQSWNADLFWITSEALNNALKHAQAASVCITLRCDSARLDLTVEDDGIGFDTARPRAGGMGLRTMAARAEALGGELIVESSPGRGARVRFWAEISPQRRREL
jgi:signal transduction histidine kinase